MVATPPELPGTEKAGITPLILDRADVEALMPPLADGWFIGAPDVDYDRALWLDGIERQFIEEADLMNILVVVDDVVLTPSLNGNIFPGVTRDSVLHLLVERGVAVEERQIAIGEVTSAAKEGRSKEPYGWSRVAVPAPGPRRAAE